MKMPRRPPICLAVLFIVLCLAEAHDVPKCSNQQRQLIGEFEMKSFTSNGYPRHYPPEDDCWWIIQAAVSDDAYSTQIVATEFDLNNENEDCSGDYVDILEGDNLGVIAKVETWCSTGPKVFMSKKKVVALKFHSGASESPGKGFSVDYSLINTPELDCDIDSLGLVAVGSSPVIATFKGKRDVQTCQWKVHDRNMDPNEMLVFELILPSNVQCNHGRYLIYEGEDTSGHVNFEYCSLDKPFSKMFLQSNVAILKFEHDGMTDPSGFTLKIYQRPLQQDINECDVSMEVPQDAPIFFSLPHVLKKSGESCPVALTTLNPDRLRVDVMGSADKPATCKDSGLITVKDSQGAAATPTCFRNRFPIYFSGSGPTTLSETTSAGAFIRVVTVDPDCGNVHRHLQATPDLALSTDIPARGHYKSLEMCTALISAPTPSDLVTLGIMWNPPENEKSYEVSENGVCQGDFFNVYDGDSMSAPLLFSSCAGSDGMRQKIDTRVVSSQQNLFVVLDTDARYSGDSVKVEFHTMPAGKGHCGEKKVIQVGRTPQILTSPRFPGPIPLNQRCVYDLVAQEGEAIVVEILESNMAENCESMLMVYEGQYHAGSKSFGKICGRQMNTFTLQNQRASLFSFSDEEMGPGGWKVSVRTEKAKTDTSKGTDGNSAAWLCASLMITLLNLMLVTLF